jgi:hypothetical protein
MPACAIKCFEIFSGSAFKMYIKTQPDADHILFHDRILDLIIQTKK